MIEINIDNKITKAEKGQTVLLAARAVDIEIPTLCYNPELKPFGACRLCVVEVTKNGRQSLVASCTHPVEEGQVIRTNTDQVTKARKFIIELMLAEAPHSPVVKQLAEEQGVETSRFAEMEDKPRECLLCGLCVRICREQVKENIITFTHRGSQCKVSTAFERDFDDKACLNCAECVYLCPVEPD